MDRRQFLYNSSLLAAGAALPFRNIWNRPAGNFKSLRRNVGYFTEKGGTIGWLASKDAMAMVDSEYPQQAKHCLNGLRNRSDHPLDLLVNTHHHGDHTGGNPVLKGVVKKMTAHENVPKLMKQANKKGDGEPNTAYPTTTYSKSWKTQLGDEIIHAHYYGPGHTSGDSVIYFEKANVVHMGDLVFNRMNPYTDRPSGASILNWIKILDKVPERYPSDAIYIFGHGKPKFGVSGDKEDVIVMKSYLEAMVSYVKDGMEKGLSKEEMMKSKKLEGFENFLYADFWTLPKNINIIYKELKSQ